MNYMSLIKGVAENVAENIAENVISKTYLRKSFVSGF